MFGKRITQLRKNKGLSQEQLSIELGLTRRVISALESGQTKANIEQIETLSRFYAVSTDYLINGTDSTLNQVERDILREIRKDDSLLDKLKQVIEAKKQIEVMAVS